MKLEPLGDSAVIATLGSGIDEATLASVLEFAAAIAAAKRPGITDVVPAYATVTAFYDPAQFSEPPGDAYDAVCRFLESCDAGGAHAVAVAGNTVEIPVCYGGDFGPDLADVAAHCRLSAAEVVALHSGADYLVHAIGFTPGFPYLGGLPDALRTPRRDTPAPARSGGLGRDRRLADRRLSRRFARRLAHHRAHARSSFSAPLREPAALLRPGDRVRFRSISAAEL